MSSHDHHTTTAAPHDTFAQLDPRQDQHTYRITTESGTRYYVRASQAGDGSMYVVSDGEYVRQIQHVRHYDRDTNPIIHVSAPLSLFDLEGGLPLRTSPVRSIDRVTETLEAIATRVATTQPGMTTSAA